MMFLTMTCAIPVCVCVPADSNSLSATTCPHVWLCCVCGTLVLLCLPSPCSHTHVGMLCVCYILYVSLLFGITPSLTVSQCVASSVGVYHKHALKYVCPLGCDFCFSVLCVLNYSVCDTLFSSCLLLTSNMYTYLCGSAPIKQLLYVCMCVMSLHLLLVCL